MTDAALDTETPALDGRFSLQQLAVLAGVSPRTVRYYIAEGLLDRPEGEKRGAHYLRRHLEQLLAIRRWTDAGDSLDQVRSRLSDSPDAARRPVVPGAVELWSRIAIADGIDIHVEPVRAGLTTAQLRQFARELLALHTRIRAESVEQADVEEPVSPPAQGDRQ